jgi:hypothetical protein
VSILSVCLLVTQNGQRVGVELHKLQSAKPCKNSVSGRVLKKRAIPTKKLRFQAFGPARAILIWVNDC